MDSGDAASRGGRRQRRVRRLSRRSHAPPARAGGGGPAQARPGAGDRMGRTMSRSQTGARRPSCWKTISATRRRGRRFRRADRQKQIERERAAKPWMRRRQLIATLQERVDMRASLAKSGSGGETGLIDAQRNLELPQDATGHAEGPARRGLGQRRRLAARKATRLSPISRGKLPETVGSAKPGRRRARKARKVPTQTGADGLTSAHRWRRSTACAVTTIGQVVGAGDELMRIVPEDEELEIECYLANQRCRLRQARPDGGGEDRRLPFHPLRRAGRDRVPRRRATRSPNPRRNSAKATQPGSISEKRLRGGERTQNLVFPRHPAPGSGHHDRRRPGRAAHPRHGRQRGNRHRPPQDPRIHLLPPGRNRVAGHEGKVTLAPKLHELA